jgi:uncharacterized protein YueI
MKYDEFVYGKNQTEGVTSIEVDNQTAKLYLASGDILNVPNRFYILYASNYSGDLSIVTGKHLLFDFFHIRIHHISFSLLAR